jgi:hypothetical protein
MDRRASIIELAPSETVDIRVKRAGLSANISIRPFSAISPPSTFKSGWRSATSFLNLFLNLAIAVRWTSVSLFGFVFRSVARDRCQFLSALVQISHIVAAGT